VGQRGTVRAGDYIFYEKYKKIINWEQEVLYSTELEFVRDRLSCIVLRGYWCNIVVLNYMHQVRRKVWIQKTVFMRNWDRVLIILLTTIWKFCWRF